MGLRLLQVPLSVAETLLLFDQTVGLECLTGDSTCLLLHFYTSLQWAFFSYY